MNDYEDDFEVDPSDEDGIKDQPPKVQGNHGIYIDSKE